MSERTPWETTGDTSGRPGPAVFVGGELDGRPFERAECVARDDGEVDLLVRWPDGGATLYGAVAVAGARVSFGGAAVEATDVRITRKLGSTPVPAVPVTYEVGVKPPPT